MALPDKPAATADAAFRYRPRCSRWRRLARNRPAMAGALVLALLMVAAAAAPWLAPAGPEAIDPYHRFAPPGTPGHPLGTDELGRDALARTLYGGRISLAIGVTTGVLRVQIRSPSWAPAPSPAPSSWPFTPPCRAFGRCGSMIYSQSMPAAWPSRKVPAWG